MVNQQDNRAGFEEYRDQRNAELERAGHKPGSQFHVDNSHWQTWLAAKRDARADSLGVTNETIQMKAEYWADWLVDAASAASQDRRLLRGDPQEDKLTVEAIEVNAKKAITNAIKAICGPSEGKGE